MARQPIPLPPQGDASAATLYSLVGEALSWWEASEDELMRLFRTICGDIEPIAMATFIAGQRRTRYNMLQQAMISYSWLFEEEEIVKVKTAMKALDVLASKRNEIGHGHVSQQTQSYNGQVTASGNYLLPSLNESGPFERTVRYAHTSETIDQFIADVRKQRGEVMDVSMEVMTRKRDRGRFGMDDQAFFSLARRIASLEIAGSDAYDKMSELVLAIKRAPGTPLS